MRVPPSPTGGLILAFTVAWMAAACSLRDAAATGDSLESWSAIPIAPDAGLAAEALNSNSACRAADDAGPLRILVQDRRTESTAAFLVTSETVFGGCILTRPGGMSGGGLGPLPEPMVGPLSIDHQGSGTAGTAIATELGGRIALPAARVIVELEDARRVTASLANGYWLTWWPGSVRATRVVALDNAGAEIAELAVVVP